MADFDFSETFDFLFALPPLTAPEDHSPVSDSTSALRTPGDEEFDFTWPPHDFALQDRISHLLDDTSLLLQQASDEGLKRDQRNEMQEVVGTVSPYDTLLRHPSTLDAGSGSQDTGLTAPRRISISPEPLVSPPALKKRMGKSKMVPCGAIPSNVTSSVRKSEPCYKEGVHYSVNSQPPVDTVEQCKWGGNCRHPFKMEQGQWTGHLQSMHPNDMKTSKPGDRIPCKWGDCNKSYSSASAMAKHILQGHFGKQWYCHLCRVHFKGDRSHIFRHCNKTASHLKVAEELEDGHKPWIVERVWKGRQDADERGHGEKGEGPSQRNLKRRREEDES